MTDRRLLAFVPQGSDSLLIQAAVAPADLARAAWQAWTAQRSLDEARWAEVRMLPSVAARAAELAIQADLLPRLDGIRRFVWAGSQKQMLAARPILARLGAQGIPFMLLKGAALIAAYPATTGRRFLRDVDILVPAERTAEAVDLISAAGWRNAFFENVEEARLIGLARTHALEFKGPEGGEVDLHRFALAPNFCAGDDDLLWSRAETASFLGLPCLRPALEDLLVTTLEHSFRRDPDQVLDWSLDAAHLIGNPRLDWQAVVEAALRRRLAVPVEARLRYLGRQCGLAVPDAVLTALEPQSREPVFVAESLANHFGGLKLPGATQRAHVRAQRRRAEIWCASAQEAASDWPVRTRPEVRLSGQGRRVDIGLPDGDIRRLRIQINAESVPTPHWTCRIHCGAISLSRLVGGNGPIDRLRRRWQAGFRLDRRLFSAQRTNDLTLFILPRWQRHTDVLPSVMDCTAELTRSRTLVVRLRLNPQ
ncbi:MAG: nucleotidyltransferase family protein [Gallionellaceae bacterium]|nr:nucleotidyltransferase family protein [Gallionellaceae bacterium]